MDRERATAFARDWLQGWNDRDIEAILAHYDEQVVFHSPRIAEVLGGVAAFVSGKAALRTYWTEALGKAPKLFFELERVFTGSDSVTLLYTNHRDQSVTETFLFGNTGKVIEVIATYE